MGVLSSIRSLILLPLFVACASQNPDLSPSILGSGEWLHEIERRSVLQRPCIFVARAGPMGSTTRLVSARSSESGALKEVAPDVFLSGRSFLREGERICAEGDDGRHYSGVVPASIAGNTGCPITMKENDGNCIIGTIADVSGAPVPRAWVGITDGDLILDSCITDIMGWYHLVNNHHDRQPRHVLVKHPRFAPLVSPVRPRIVLDDGVRLRIKIPRESSVQSEELTVIAYMRSVLLTGVGPGSEVWRDGIVVGCRVSEQEVVIDRAPRPDWGDELYIRLVQVGSLARLSASARVQVPDGKSEISIEDWFAPLHYVPDLSTEHNLVLFDRHGALVEAKECALGLGDVGRYVPVKDGEIRFYALPHHDKAAIEVPGYGEQQVRLTDKRQSVVLPGGVKARLRLMGEGWDVPLAREQLSVQAKLVKNSWLLCGIDGPDWTGEFMVWLPCEGQFKLTMEWPGQDGSQTADYFFDISEAAEPPTFYVHYRP